jgi:hypothetical protein
MTSDSDDELPSAVTTGAELATLLEEDDDLGEGIAHDGAGMRTKHETNIDIGPVDLSHVSINPSTAIERLGVVEKKMGPLVIIRAYTDGEYRVLDEGAIVVTENREIFGTVLVSYNITNSPADLRDVWTCQKSSISRAAFRQTALQPASPRWRSLLCVGPCLLHFHSIPSRHERQ